MLYSVNMLRNFQRRTCCKEITENGRNISRPHGKVIIFVVIGSVGQPSWRTVGDLQLSISFTVLYSTCKISWRTKLQKPRNVQHFLFLIKRRNANHSWRPSSKAARKKELSWYVSYAHKFLLKYWLRERRPMAEERLLQHQLSSSI